jgi:pilus assembly protein CpaE
MNVVVAQSPGAALGPIVRDAGLTVAATLPIGELQALERATARSTDVLILDVRGRGTVPAEVSALKRRYPKMGVLLVAARLDPALMLEAMRAGVTEVITDPVSPVELRSAVERLVGQFLPKVTGEVLAFIGAKGGVGTTTLAANLATSLVTDHKAPVVLVDLHTTTYGDTALLLGVEPRFSVADALENVSRMDEAYVRDLVVRTEQGLDLLASPERPSFRPPEPARVRQLLHRLVDLYRWVVLDLPQSEAGLVEPIEPISAIGLVVTQELPAVRRAADLAALLRQRYGTQKLGMVVSRFDAGADIRPEDIQKAVGLPIWAQLPADYRRVVAAANLGKPLVSDTGSRVTPVIRQLANKFATAPRPDIDKSSTGPKFKRLAGLF